MSQEGTTPRWLAQPPAVITSGITSGLFSSEGPSCLICTPCSTGGMRHGQHGGHPRTLCSPEEPVTLWFELGPVHVGLS